MEPLGGPTERRNSAQQCIFTAALGIIIASCAKVFNILDKLVAFEDALNKHLWHLQTTDMTKISSRYSRIISFSIAISGQAGRCQIPRMYTTQPWS